MSGFVAHKMSGYYESHKGGFHEMGTSTTGNSDIVVHQRVVSLLYIDLIIMNYFLLLPQVINFNQKSKPEKV